MKYRKTTIIKSVAAVSLALLLSAAIYLYAPNQINPSSESLSKDSESFDVEIIRDEWGVPHVFGETDPDVAFGLAYAHAEDDFQTIQETVAATRGVLASYRGKASAPIDYIVKLMGVWEALDANYDKIPEDVKSLADGYAAGVNLYASQHPESTWQGLAPFTGKDVIAGFMFKTPFFYGFDKHLQDLFDEDRRVEVALAPNVTTRAWQLQRQGINDLGSNAMAVQAARSTDATTRLLINSHQPMTGPVAWYEARLVSEQGLNIYGGLFPGTPLILHGFNQNLGWANTVNHIDLVDTYKLDLNPEQPNQYLLDGAWKDFETTQAEFKIKLWGPFMWSVKREVLRSVHGPVIRNGDQAIAVRYAGMNEFRQLEQYYRLNKAETWSDFYSAMKMNALPSINYIYADKDDTIAFIHNAQYPARNDAWNWKNDLPGNDSSLIWQDYLPFERVPLLLNPESGLIFNANNTPFVATDGRDNLLEADFPQSMGLATDNTNRAYRLMELNDGVTRISKQSFLKQKFDIEYSKQSKYYQILEKVLAQDWSSEPDLVEVQNRIKAWNRRADIGNRYTALPIQILRNILRADDPEDHSAETLKKATKLAIQNLNEVYGRIDPKWGETNRLLRGEFDQPVNGGPDLLRAIYSMEEAEDGRPFATHGDTWMALVEWSDNGEQKADILHQFGSATLDQSSKHYSDQASLFVEEKWRTAILNKDEVLKNASRIYSPKSGL